MGLLDLLDVEKVGHYAEIARNIALAVAAIVGLFFSPRLWNSLLVAAKATARFFRSAASLPGTLEETNIRLGDLERKLNERADTHTMLSTNLQELTERIKRIDHQVHPNGGKSLNDMVKMIANELSEVRASQHTTNNVLRVCWDALGTFGVFYCRPDGANTYCSAVYLKWVGALPTEMEGYNWINYIYPPDRQAVVREWESCAEDERHFYMAYRMMNNGDPFEVEVSAQPLRNQAGDVVQWVGMVRKLRPDAPAHERRSNT